ncbi:hypothetical protein [Sulfuricurvum sp.]|uniref:hypothetical protein n=1 Tax=Sulfuricurvum sp. TaxID=2025608 RepID=UPI0019A44645|nr:hypothetical protein [Sulfuricurvum sp.]MBD3806460.1 hypothetical protein [Sulfuricurvum sp.]
MHRRSGVVLLLTIVLVAIMSGIVSVVLSQSERLWKLSQSHFNHSAALVLLGTLEAKLPSLLSKIESAEELDLAMKLPISMESINRDFLLNATLSSSYSKLNINRLVKPDGSLNDPYVTAWMRIFDYYPIADPEMLLKLVLDTIDTDLSERGTDTEIIWSVSDFKNGSIRDPKVFGRVLERYILMSGDKTVLDIPWDDYIGFEGDKVDVNAMNVQTLALLAPGVSAEKGRALTTYRTKAFTTKEEVISAEPALGGVFDTFLFIYTPGTSYTLKCDVSLTQKSAKEFIRFDYNLLDKKIRHVEFL